MHPLFLAHILVNTLAIALTVEVLPGIGLAEPRIDNTLSHFTALASFIVADEWHGFKARLQRLGNADTLQE
jgi:hypothetical protein